MINLYIKRSEVVSAVKLEDTSASIIECYNFVIGSRRDHAAIDMNSGISIKFPEWSLNANYGNYIAKDAQGDFHVFCDDVFDSGYIKILRATNEEEKQ